MIELAPTYCGNWLADDSLAAAVATARQAGTCLEVDLDQADSAKGRIHAHPRSGGTVGIVKGRDRPLQDGDVFETESGRLLVVHLTTQKVMVLRFTGSAEGYGLQLIHLGHVLGNHHWPIVIQSDQIYVQLVAAPDLMEAIVAGFKIPGLAVSYELRSPEQYLTFSAHAHA